MRRGRVWNWWSQCFKIFFPQSTPIKGFIEGRGGGVSESEAEEDDASHVTTPSGVVVRGVVGGATSSVRLVELEEGLLDGEILHHEFVEKTEEEKKEMRESREKRKREREKRRKGQDKNVKKKKLERDPGGADSRPPSPRSPARRRS